VQTISVSVSDAHCVMAKTTSVEQLTNEANTTLAKFEKQVSDVRSWLVQKKYPEMHYQRYFEVVEQRASMLRKLLKVQKENETSLTTAQDDAKAANGDTSILELREFGEMTTHVLGKVEAAGGLNEFKEAMRQLKEIKMKSLAFLREAKRAGTDLTLAMTRRDAKDQKKQSQTARAQEAASQKHAKAAAQASAAIAAGAEGNAQRAKKPRQEAVCSSVAWHAKTHVRLVMCVCVLEWHGHKTTSASDARPLVCPVQANSCRHVSQHVWKDLRCYPASSSRRPMRRR